MSNMIQEGSEPNMKHYLETTEAVFKEVASSEAGLTTEEAEKRIAATAKTS